jgi:hypothetical protein
VKRRKREESNQNEKHRWVEWDKKGLEAQVFQQKISKLIKTSIPFVSMTVSSWLTKIRDNIIGNFFTIGTLVSNEHKQERKKMFSERLHDEIKSNWRNRDNVRLHSYVDEVYEYTLRIDPVRSSTREWRGKQVFGQSAENGRFRPRRWISCIFGNSLEISGIFGISPKIKRKQIPSIN